MTQEALKLALEALEWCHGGEPCGTAEAIAVVKKALAQTQEPVAMLAVREHAPVGKVAYVLEVNLPVGIHKLYTTPPQRTWVGLTDDEQQQVYEQWQDGGWGVFYNAIEAKLKEKNG